MSNGMDKVKIVVTAVMATLSGWLGILAVPVLVLLLMELIDYGTGLAAAKYRKEEVSSYKSIRGIAKKVCILLLVGVGAALDWLVAFAAESMGLALPFNFLIASVVAIWLICNEIISIIENMNDIGVVMPPFLQSIAKYIRRQAEAKTALKEEDEENAETR